MDANVLAINFENSMTSFLLYCLRAKYSVSPILFERIIWITAKMPECPEDITSARIPLIFVELIIT